MSSPKIGDRSGCKLCGEQIEFIGPYWRHVNSDPRHIAVPVDKPAMLAHIPVPINYKNAYDRLFEEAEKLRAELTRLRAGIEALASDVNASVDGWYWLKDRLQALFTPPMPPPPVSEQEEPIAFSAPPWTIDRDNDRRTGTLIRSSRFMGSNVKGVAVARMISKVRSDAEMIAVAPLMLALLKRLIVEDGFVDEELAQDAACVIERIRGANR